MTDCTIVITDTEHIHGTFPVDECLVFIPFDAVVWLPIIIGVLFLSLFVRSYS